MVDPIQSFLETNGLVAAAFGPGSRYQGVATAQHTQPDGTVVAYIKRRFVPQPSSFALVQEHQVVAGDRLDNLAARYLGDATQFWRICDANSASGPLRPDVLTATPGERVRITLPEGVQGVLGGASDGS